MFIKNNNGSVLFGHNEDDSGTREVNAWLVPRAVHAKGQTIRLRNGEPLDFAKTYRTQSSDSEALKKRRFDFRQWRGLSLLSGQHIPEEKAESVGLPFSIRPGRKIGVEEVMAVLRDHFENTKYQVHPSGTANPHTRGERPICFSTTLFSIVTQPRASMPLPLRACFRVAFGRPDTSPYAPWYSCMYRIPRHSERPLFFPIQTRSAL